MKNFFIIFFAVFFISFVDSFAAEPGESLVAPAVKEIMRIDDNGISPQSIVLTKPDASVFFLNGTRNSELSIAIFFGKRRLHCASENLKMGEDGALRTINPIKPRNFVLSCFPVPGRYKIEVDGFSSGKKMRMAEVVVKGK